MPTSLTRLFPPATTTVDKGHGRLEVRSLKSTTILNDYVAFPHVKQVLKIVRTRTELKPGKESSETVFVITSQPPERADHARLMKQVRGHWAIENLLHYVRDWVFDEDRSTIRSQHGPASLAMLRNVALALIRFQGETAISAAIRRNARKADRALKLLGV